ncbi:MAG: hypothetical protein AAF380_02030, partial [Bacteroidota bacterium]
MKSKITYASYLKAICLLLFIQPLHTHQQSTPHKPPKKAKATSTTQNHKKKHLAIAGTSIAILTSIAFFKDPSTTTPEALTPSHHNQASAADSPQQKRADQPIITPNHPPINHNTHQSHTIGLEDHIPEGPEGTYLKQEETMHHSTITTGDVTIDCDKGSSSSQEIQNAIDPLQNITLAARWRIAESGLESLYKMNIDSLNVHPADARSQNQAA